MPVILFFLSCLNLFLFVLSLYKIHQSRQKVIITYWAVFLGAFTWEDLLIFSILNFMATIFIFFLHDLRVGILYFVIFWIVRNSGEIIYWFLQQFNQPTLYPHDQYHEFRFVHKITGKISFQQTFIIMQVLHESLLIVFIMSLIGFLINWNNIPRWF